jgi:hypothetical protein
MRQHRTALQQISAFLGDRQTYTPAWTSTGSAPAIGNGSLSGQYQQIGKLVTFNFSIVFGSTTTFGSGSYRFSIPVASSGLGGMFGHATLFDSGVEWRAGCAIFYVSASVIAIAQDHNIGSGIDPAQPWTFKNGDAIFGSGAYWAA